VKETVNQLKKKHRDYIWLDQEGDYWYWDAIKLKWCVILADIDCGFYISDQFDPVYYNHFARIAEPPLAKARRAEK